MSEKKYMDWRDRLEKCCGSRPEINDFGAYMFIKCRLGENPCTRFLCVGTADGEKILKLWKFMIEEDIILVDLKEN